MAKEKGARVPRSLGVSEWDKERGRGRLRLIMEALGKKRIKKGLRSNRGLGWKG